MDGRSHYEKSLCSRVIQINNKQCTVCHADIRKLTHVSTKVVSQEIKLMQQEFEKETTLTISCSKVHNYLRMTLNFSRPGKVQIKMFEYINKMLQELRGHDLISNKTHQRKSVQFQQEK